MNKMKFLVVTALLLLCAGLFTGCKTVEKNDDVTMHISTTKAHFSKESLLRNTELIIKGKVLQKNSEVMSNPDGTRKTAEGYQILNSLITEYTVEIQEIYKGEYAATTVDVKTYSGYGTDASNIIFDEENSLYLNVGEECILLLNYVDDGYDEGKGYFPTQAAGYLIQNEDGSFSNGSTSSPLTLSLDTIEQEITTACQE